MWFWAFIIKFWLPLRGLGSSRAGSDPAPLTRSWWGPREKPGTGWGHCRFSLDTYRAERNVWVMKAWTGLKAGQDTLEVSVTSGDQPATFQQAPPSSEPSIRRTSCLKSAYANEGLCRLCENVLSAPRVLACLQNSTALDRGSLHRTLVSLSLRGVDVIRERYILLGPWLQTPEMSLRERQLHWLARCEFPLELQRQGYGFQMAKAVIGDTWEKPKAWSMLSLMLAFSFWRWHRYSCGFRHWPMVIQGRYKWICLRLLLLGSHVKTPHTQEQLSTPLRTVEKLQPYR